MTNESGTRSSSLDAGKLVLILGGYGNVGQRIAKLLADDPGVRLVIGGRHVGRARRFAATLPGGAGARAVDIDDPQTYRSALEGVGAVIMCLGTTELAFPHACVTRGICYIDISASYEVIERLGFLQDLAGAHRATIISSVGLAPGLTSLLVKACVRSTGEFVSNIDVHLLFGLGDRHGKATLEWLVDRLHRPFTVGLHGVEHEVWPFEERAQAHFPPPFGERGTYRLDFSDQHTLPRTLGVPSVRTWVTCDRERLAHRLSILARLGVLRWTGHRAVRRFAVCLLRALRGGSDRFAVMVEAASEGAGRGAVSATATGVGEARATAVMVAATLRRVLGDPPPAGVFQLEDLYDLADFDRLLSINGIEVQAPAVSRPRNNARPDPGTFVSDAGGNIEGAGR